MHTETTPIPTPKVMQCLGTPLHLKNKFGTGYTLSIAEEAENGGRIPLQGKFHG
jgi:hypothetical protein